MPRADCRASDGAVCVGFGTSGVWGRSRNTGLLTTCPALVDARNKMSARIDTMATAYAALAAAAAKAALPTNSTGDGLGPGSSVGDGGVPPGGVAAAVDPTPAIPSIPMSIAVDAAPAIMSIPVDAAAAIMSIAVDAAAAAGADAVATGRRRTDGGDGLAGRMSGGGPGDPLVLLTEQLIRYGKFCKTFFVIYPVSPGFPLLSCAAS